MQHLIDVLFVEKWESNLNYELFYKECQPKECFHTYIERSTNIYTITLIFSVLGGLTKGLPVIIPLLIKISHKIMIRFKRQKYLRQKRNQNRINPITSSIIT